MTSRNPRIGVGLRRAHWDDVLGNPRTTAARVDFFEIIAENFIDFGGRPRATLEAVRRDFDIAVHGVSLSVGGADPLDPRFIERLPGLLDGLGALTYSDHLCASRAHGVEYHDLLPVHRTHTALTRIADRIDRVSTATGRPFIFENISYYMELPGAEYDEAAFIGALVARTGAGLLLDVNNIYVNAVNHGFDPYAFIDALPLAAVRQIHIAGHDDSGPFLVDTHGAPVRAEVFKLLRYALRRVGPVDVLLEWDNDIPAFERLLQEADTVRAEALMTAGGETEPRFVIEPRLHRAESAPTAAAAADPSPVIHGLVRESLAVDDAARALGVPRVRADLYRRLVKGHVRTALEKIYTTLMRAVPQGQWDEWVASYDRAHPPTHYELNATALAFPLFLENVGAAPFLIELAQLEWAEFAVMMDEAAVTPGLNPTLTLFAFDYPVASWLAARRAGDESAPVTTFPAPSPEKVAVVRDAAFDVRIVPLSEADIALLQAVSAGADAQSLATATGVSLATAEAALTRLAERALLVTA
jgi:uncharacterized protein